MNYFLFKLRFETAVHFGPSDAALPLAASEEHVRADTLFSALCQTALCLYGPEGVVELWGQVQEGKLLLRSVQSKRVALSLGGIWSGQRRRHPRGAMRSLTKWGYFNIRGLAGRRNGKNASIVRMPGHVVGSTSCVPASRSRLTG